MVQHYLESQLNYPDKLAKTMLAYMVNGLYGGTEFLTKMVCKLKAEFQ